MKNRDKEMADYPAPTQKEDLLPVLRSKAPAKPSSSPRPGAKEAAAGVVGKMVETVGAVLGGVKNTLVGEENVADINQQILDLLKQSLDASREMMQQTLEAGNNRMAKLEELMADLAQQHNHLNDVKAAMMEGTISENQAQASHRGFMKKAAVAGLTLLGVTGIGVCIGVSRLGAVQEQLELGNFQTQQWMSGETRPSTH